MKITFEKLDKGFLVTAEDAGITERLAYENSSEAFAAVAQALGVVSVPGELRRAPNAPVAPSPDLPDLNDEAPEPALDRQPPATRRIGLTARKSAPPAGRR